MWMNAGYLLKAPRVLAFLRTIAQKFCDMKRDIQQDTAVNVIFHNAAKESVNCAFILLST